MLNLPTIPCLFAGPDLNWNNIDVHLQHRERWLQCLHPEKPLGGENVSPCIGCGRTCPGYSPDTKYEVRGLAPLSVKKLRLHHAGAFNASIVRYNGQLLLAYREAQHRSRLFVAELDDNYKALRVHKVKIDHERATIGQEDPRLFIHRGKLHLMFVGVDPFDEHTYGIRANVLYARLDDRFQPEAVYYPHYANRSVWEKNWAFFSHDDRLYCVYEIKPHTVFEIEEDRIVHVYQTPTPHPWEGGHLRGGSAPHRVGDSYYHWFHGRVGAGTGTIYNTGLYRFRAEPPFAVEAMTREPIQWADPNSRVGATAAVVFVCGAILEDDKWRVSMGVHDRGVEVATYDHTAVEKTLEAPKLHVPPVFALYCDEIPDRKTKLAEHLHDRGIIPGWWRSVHGKTWGLLSSKVYTRGEFPINAGQAGLILGHYMLWQHLYQCGYPDAIILEDDAYLCENFQDKVAVDIANLPQNANFLYVGHLAYGDRIEQKIKRHVAPNIVEMKEPIWGTHAYYVKRSALEILLQRMKELRSPADWQLWENVLRDRHLDWYVCQESRATQWSAVGLMPTTLSGHDYWKLHPEPLRSQIEMQTDLPGWCELDKARMMCGLLLREQPETVVEIGVYGGKSLVPQALTLRHNKRGVIYGIDPWTNSSCTENYPDDLGWWEEIQAAIEEQEGRSHPTEKLTRFRAIVEKAREKYPRENLVNAKWWGDLKLEDIFAIMCDRITRNNLWKQIRLISAPSHRVVTLFDERPIDVLHIDGNHSKESSCRDVQLYLPRVKEGGYVWFDDSNWKTTQDALRELDHQCTLLINSEQPYGSFRLYRKN